MTATLLNNAEKFVIDLLNKKLASIYVYHNLVHTQSVVEKVIELAENLKVDEISSEN